MREPVSFARPGGVLVLLGVVALCATGLLVVGPRLVAQTAAAGARRQQQLLADQAAGQIAAALGEIHRRFEDPAVRAQAGIDEARDRSELEQALARLGRPWDRERGVVLLVHDSRGHVMAVDPRVRPESARAILGHVHDVRDRHDDVGVCSACLSHFGAVSFVTPLDGGLELSVNVDAAAVAGAALDAIAARSGGRAWLEASAGARLFTAGDTPVEASGSHDELAVAPVGDSDGAWRVVVATPTGVLAPGVRARTRVLVGIAVAIVVLTVASLLWLGRSRLRQQAERLRLLRAMAQQDKLATIGLLSAATAHEINNALTVAMMAAAAMRDDCQGSQAEDLDDVQSSLDRMREIAAALLRHGRHDDGQGCFAVSDAVADAVRIAAPMFKGSRGVTCEIGEVLAVRGSRSAVTQVVVNLLLNARQAMAGPAPGGVRVTARKVDGTVELQVEDDGPGIPAEVLPHIFEPMFTTKPADVGTGLGLWISRKIIDQHGGAITVSNGTGGGARFTIELPASSERTASPRADAPAAAARTAVL